MKDNLFQRIFDRKSQSKASRSRRLSLESLENREMLNVDWGGFAPETTTEYSTTTTAAYSVDLPSDVDMCDLVNLEGDSKDELVAIYGKGKTVSVYTCDTDGHFSLETEQTIPELGNWQLYSDVVFSDLNSDGYQDMLVVSSTGVAMSATVYNWSSTTSKFVAGTTYTLDVTPFVASDSSRYVFTEIGSALVNNASGGYDLVLQVSTLSPSSSTSKTAVYSGVGTSSFGTSPVTKSAVSGTLLGSTTIDGESYLIGKEATGTTNYLTLTKLGTSTTSKTTYDFSNYGSKFVFNWVVEQDGFLVVGSVLGGTGKSGLVTLNLTEAPVDNTTVDATTLGQWIACDSITLNSSSLGAIGDCGGDSDVELVVANDDENASVFYLGDASTTYGYTFTESKVVVSSPEYNSVYVGDYDSDGSNEAVLVGSNYIYVADVSDSGKLSNQKELFKFSQPVSQAVFGDFNGDGLIDVAVQYRANVGSSLQVFRQISDGSFVSLTTQTIPGTFADLTVGKFSQTSVDEIGVAYTFYKNSTTATTVSTYKLDTVKNSLTATYSCTYVGSGSAITAGELYGSGRDDLVVVNSSEDTVTVLRNTGSSLVATSVTTRYEGVDVCYPTSAAIGDFNADGLADLAVMNSSSGTNVAEIAYYLRSASGIGSKPTGRVRVNSTVTTVDNTSIVGELQCADLNSDGYSDLAFVREATDGSVYVSVFMGNGGSSVFDSILNTAVSCDPTKSLGACLTKVDSGNVSSDFVWVQGKTFATLLNKDATSAAGSVQYVLQSLSASAGDSLSAALTTQRTWLDEWSNFYVDVWATTSSSDAVTSVAGEFSYDNTLFSYVETESAEGYGVTAIGAAGKVAYSATGTASADSDGWVLVARMRFEPVENGGLALSDDGALYAVDPAFSASSTAQKVNSSAVKTITTPSDVEVYPYAFDLNDNGQVDLEDFTLILKYFPSNPISNIDVPKYRALDVNGNKQYDLEEYTVGVAAFSTKSTNGKDSAYQTKPTIASSASAAVLSESLLDEDSDAAFLDDDELDAVAESVLATTAARSVEQSLSSAEIQTASPSAFYGPMPKSYYADLDLDVDLDVEF